MLEYLALITSIIALIYSIYNFITIRIKIAKLTKLNEAISKLKK